MPFLRAAAALAREETEPPSRPHKEAARRRSAFSEFVISLLRNGKEAIAIICRFPRAAVDAGERSRFLDLETKIRKLANRVFVIRNEREPDALRTAPFDAATDSSMDSCNRLINLNCHLVSSLCYAGRDCPRTIYVAYGVPKPKPLEFLVF